MKPWLWESKTPNAFIRVILINEKDKIYWERDMKTASWFDNDCDKNNWNPGRSNQLNEKLLNFGSVRTKIWNISRGLKYPTLLLITIYLKKRKPSKMPSHSHSYFPTFLSRLKSSVNQSFTPSFEVYPSVVVDIPCFTCCQWNETNRWKDLSVIRDTWKYSSFTVA